jgi:hypothetical protein
MRTLIECGVCDGEGVRGHECGEDCCNCLRPEPNAPCWACGGEGEIEVDEDEQDAAESDVRGV